MARNHLRQGLLRHLQQILRPAVVEDLTDDQLLTRFLTSADQAAFALLVRRHGPMVLGVCRRVLRHTQDAEDAFQATFLILARKAASVAHRQALSSWLYRVAYRIAVEAKSRNDRRRAREKQVDELPHAQVLPTETQDWRTWLDHELNLLPERYRAVLIACDLEERSRKEAALLLGLAEGTVSSRLARGRSLLAKRLARYGLSLSGGTLATAFSQDAAAALSSALTSATISMATGRGVITASVALLTKGALEAMFLTKLKWTVGVVMMAVALGATGLAYRVSGQSTPAPAEKEVRDKPPTELEILRREIELLKLKLEVVQEKQRAQEAELRALRAAPREPANPKETQKAGRRLASDAAGNLPGVIALVTEVHLKWPKALQNADFNGTRELLECLMKAAHKSVSSGDDPSAATLHDLQANLRAMEKILENTKAQFSPEEYMEAKRYLAYIQDTVMMVLHDPKIFTFWMGRGKGKAIPSGRQPAGEAKPEAQQEADAVILKKLRAEVKILEDRAHWSERMSQPKKQYVAPAQADADKARLREARTALLKMETRVHLQQAEQAMKALREARDPETKQRAAKELEKVLKQLREEMDRVESVTPPPLRP